MLSCISRARAVGALSLMLTPLASVTAQRSKACWLVTPAEAAQLLGRPDLASGDVMDDDRQTCSYTHAGFDVHMDHSRTPERARAALEQNIKSGKAEAVAGVGDLAGFDKNAKQPSLLVIKGGRVVETTILSSRWKGSPDQIKPTLVKLAEIALAKPATATAQASRACWLITPAEVADILGRPELKKGDAMHDDYDDCDYKGAGFDVDVIGYTRVLARSEGFKNLVQRGSAEAIPGVGDDAIIGHDADKHPTINVLKGKRELMITWLDSTQASAANLKPKLVQLAKTAIARLQ